MHLKSKKHVLNLVGVAAVGCELEVVWLFYNGFVHFRSAWWAPAYVTYTLLHVEKVLADRFIANFACYVQHIC